MTSFSIAGSKSSSSFFAPLLFPAADDDDPLLLRPGERPPDRPGPPRLEPPPTGHPAAPRSRLVQQR